MPTFTLLLLIGAGAALVVQNLLMATISGQVSTLLIPLALNSAVGLMLLTGLLLWQGGGTGALREAASGLRALHIVPGLLGTFFVFASLTGYRQFGAAPTIAILVTSQLIFGLGADWLRAGAGKPDLAPILGAALLVAGCALILFRKG